MTLTGTSATGGSFHVHSHPPKRCMFVPGTGGFWTCAAAMQRSAKIAWEVFQRSASSYRTHLDTLILSMVPVSHLPFKNPKEGRLWGLYAGVSRRLGQACPFTTPSDSHPVQVAEGNHNTARHSRQFHHSKSSGFRPGCFSSKTLKKRTVELLLRFDPRGIHTSSVEIRWGIAPPQPP